MINRKCCEVRCSAKFKRPSVLAACRHERLIEKWPRGSPRVRSAASEQCTRLESIKFGLENPFGVVNRGGEPLLGHLQCSLGFPEEQQGATQQDVERRSAALIPRAATPPQRPPPPRGRVGGGVEHGRGGPRAAARPPPPLAESVLLRERQTALGMALRNRWLAAQSVENR